MADFPDPNLDYRQHPEAYRVDRGERGVLTCEPYKSELLPLWRFKTPAEAKKSSAAIYRKFTAFVRQKDFAGADLARKFIQMGWTRSRRYANHPGGRKYKPRTREVLPQQIDPVKAESAAIFFERLKKVRKHAGYLELAAEHKSKVAATIPASASKSSGAARHGSAAAAGSRKR